MKALGAIYVLLAIIGPLVLALAPWFPRPEELR